MKLELTVGNQLPPVIEGISWTTERRGKPAKLTFTVVRDKDSDFTEGSIVKLTVNDAEIFYGYIFRQSCDKDKHINITAYDQTRYLLNKDTYIYTNKTASDVIQMIADDYRIQLGTIEKTSYNIKERIEDNKTLFDIIYSALDLELTNNKKMFVLYDDFGKLTLKALDDMRLDLLIDGESGENFSYSSSIDDQT